MQATAKFEAGVNGNTVTLGAGEASATKWDNVSISGTTTTKYDTTHVYGTLACKIVSDASSSPTYMEWQTATVGAPTTVYGRIYLYLTANPGTAYSLVRVLKAGSRAAEIAVNTTGTLLLRDSGGTQRGATTSTVTLNQWVRIEFKVVNDITNGVVEVKLYNSPDSGTVTQTVTSTGAFSTLANTDAVRFGMISGSASYTSWLDNLLFNDTGYPGPLNPANTVAPAVTGTTNLGDTLTSDNGTWVGDATIAFTYQWQRDAVNIGGATANTRVIAAADQGHNLRCVVTGTNSTGALAANSNTVAVPAASGGSSAPNQTYNTGYSYYF